MNFLQKGKRRIQKLFWHYFWQNFQLPRIPISNIINNICHDLPGIAEHICMPPYMGDVNFQDYSFLISMIKELKPTRVLELGTAHGNTVANICAVSDANVYTVNALPEDMTGDITTFALTREEIGSVYRKYGFEDRVVQIYSNTKKINILEWVVSKSVDFAIIDACHDADFVVNDFLKIYPCLSDQATVVFHDTNPSGEKHLLDSYLGCMYLRKMGFNVKQLENSSWGFWSAKDARHPQSLNEKIINVIYTVNGILIFGNRDRFIRTLRWLASGFLRGKFSTLTST